MEFFKYCRCLGVIAVAFSHSAVAQNPDPNFDLATLKTQVVIKASAEWVPIKNEVEIETGEAEAASEENTDETAEIALVSYEDFNVNNITGYSNYIDEYGTGRSDFRVVICDVNSPDTLCDNVHDQTTYRGIALGDSREQVLKKYGEPGSEVVYKNKRWNQKERIKW